MHNNPECFGNRGHQLKLALNLRPEQRPELRAGRGGLCIQFPAPRASIQLQEPRIQLSEPRIQLSASSSLLRSPASSSQSPVSTSQYPAPNIQLPVPSSLCWVSWSLQQPQRFWLCAWNTHTCPHFPIKVLNFHFLNKWILATGH